MDSGDLGVGVENYRAFRYNWTGLPNEVPAIVALENDEGVTAYVSWNGDTETVAWRFYAVSDEYGSREFLGEVPRTSFETSLQIKGNKVKTVLADSIDAHGKVLTTTGQVKTEVEILQIKPKASEAVPELSGDQKVLDVKSKWEEYGLLKYLRVPVILGGDL